MLKQVVSEAEAIYLAKAEEIGQWQRDRSLIPHMNPITPEQVMEWLRGVVHVASHNYSKKNTYALAYFKKQRITYNMIVVEEHSYEDNLDTVLHELGHLFCWHFFRKYGHDNYWKMIGTIVGYAQVGATSMERRRRYHAFAREAGRYQTQGHVLGTVSTHQSTPVVRSRSKVDSPVQLVWAVCEVLAPKGATRKEIINRCVAAGVNRNTASTQYYHWKRARQKSI